MIFCYLRAFEPVIQHGICVLPDTHTHIHTHAYLSEDQKKTAYLEYWNFLDKNFTFVHFDKFLTEQNLFSSIFDLQLEKCIHCTHFQTCFLISTFEHLNMALWGVILCNLGAEKNECIMFIDMIDDEASYRLKKTVSA